MVNKLKIFIDGSCRKAVSRMFPYWESEGCRIVTKSRSANVQLSVARISIDTELPTLLRIDGIYYDKADNFLARNITISESHMKASAIVYQSELSKLMCEKFLGKRTTSLFDVVYNGVCESNWKRKEKVHQGINVFACAKWRRVKRLPELVQIFKAFVGLYPDAKLHVIGPIAKGEKKRIFPNVVYYGKLEIEEIKKLYCSADVHVHLCKKDSCPSNVPESIAAGIPVVTTNLCGGATEMCSLSPGCVVVYEGKQFIKEDYIYGEAYNAMTTRAIANVVKAMSNIAEEKKKIKLPAKLSIEHVAKKYLSMLRKIYASS